MNRNLLWVPIVLLLAACNGNDNDNPGGGDAFLDTVTTLSVSAPEDSTPVAVESLIAGQPEIGEPLPVL